MESNNDTVIRFNARALMRSGDKIFEKNKWLKTGTQMIFIIHGDQESMIREALKGRKFAIIKVPRIEGQEPWTNYHDHIETFIYFSAFQCPCGIREIGSDTTFYNFDYFLCVENGRDFDKGLKKAIKKDAKLIVQSDIDEALSFLKDKELVFRTSFAEQGGNYEASLINHVISKDLSLKPEEMYFLYDDTYDVKIFLQELPDNEENTAGKRLIPVDANRYDVTQKIVSILDALSKECRRDIKDLSFEYDTEDGEIKAHYYLTRFHSNPAWRLNPVCLFNFRISVFILPGFVDKEDVQDIQEDSIVIRDDDKRYKLDSIHFTSDICYDLSAFKDLMEWHYLDVDLA